MRYFVWYYCHLSIPLTHSATSETPIQGWGRQTWKRAKPYFATTCSRVHMPGTAVCLRGSRHLLSHQAEGFSQDLPRTSRHWAFLWLIENSCAPRKLMSTCSGVTHVGRHREPLKPKTLQNHVTLFLSFVCLVLLQYWGLYSQPSSC